MSSHYDLLIAGGGLAGASLACALGATGRRVAVIEAFSLEDPRQPSFDERTIALTWASRVIFEAMGIWESVSDDAGAIERIHISDRGHFGKTRLDCRDAGTEALGYVVPTRSLGNALHRRLEALKNVNLVCPATAESARVDTGIIQLQTESGDTLAAPLLVLADGGRSLLGDCVGLKLNTQRYAQRALVTIVEVDGKHERLAYERFTEHGPIALLPMTGRRFSVAWTLPEDVAEMLCETGEDEFLASLQQAFGDTAGNFIRCGRRTTYPLSLGHLPRTIARRTVAVGNAAHIVHPVAGQGFNLGLRDVAELVDYLCDCWATGEDPGLGPNLESYDKSRHAQTERVSRFTDGLIGLFRSRLPGLATARGIGLDLVDLSASSRRFFLRRTMGLHGHLPRMARGLPPAPVLPETASS